MKKRLVGLMVAGIAVFALTGCGGGGDDEPAVEIHYLIDSFGEPVAGIGYDCLSGEHGVTDPEGGYYFDPYGDSCDFYLSRYEDDLHIEDSAYYGVNGLRYVCYHTDGFTGDYIGTGGYAGGFDHDWSITDVCTIDY